MASGVSRRVVESSAVRDGRDAWMERVGRAGLMAMDVLVACSRSADRPGPVDVNWTRNSTDRGRCSLPEQP